MIHIVGLGPGNAEALTLGAWKALHEYPVYLRTKAHPTVARLEEEGLKYVAFDHYYEEKETFEEVYGAMAQEVLLRAQEGDLVYAVPGHPLVAEKSVSLLLEACTERGIPHRIHPAVSFVDTVLEELRLDPIAGVRIVDALDIDNISPDFTQGMIITQVYSAYVAGQVKLALGRYLEDEDEVVFIRAAGTPEASIRTLPLYALDRQKDIDHLTSVYLPPKPQRYDFYRFMGIIRRLRDKDGGCPWDLEQTHETLKRYLIEESYEALEAIDLEDPDKMAEEFGDVLLQVALHSIIGEETGEFDIHEVIRTVTEKMIYRHPHVFQRDKDMTSDEVLVQWEALKKKEKKEESLGDSLKEISKHYPALSRAEKIQKKARKYGFDWDDIEEVFKKITEETAEIREAMKTGDARQISGELGDLLFAVVNLARFLDSDPELALNETSDKFIRRILRMEELLTAKELKFQDLPLEELDKYWETAKKEEKI